MYFPYSTSKTFLNVSSPTLSEINSIRQQLPLLSARRNDIYTIKENRPIESDILELSDQFGGMLLDRPERIGFKPDEALVLLQYRNLKDVNNRVLPQFINFVEDMERVKI